MIKCGKKGCFGNCAERRMRDDGSWNLKNTFFSSNENQNFVLPFYDYYSSWLKNIESIRLYVFA